MWSISMISKWILLYIWCMQFASFVTTVERKYTYTSMKLLVVNMVDRSSHLHDTIDAKDLWLWQCWPVNFLIISNWWELFVQLWTAGPQVLFVQNEWLIERSRASIIVFFRSRNVKHQRTNQTCLAHVVYDHHLEFLICVFSKLFDLNFILAGWLHLSGLILLI